MNAFDSPLDYRLRFHVNDMLLSSWDKRKVPRKVAAFIALYTGLRRQEICDLRREDVDFIRGSITVRRRKKRSKSTPIFHIIPLNPRLQEILRERYDVGVKKYGRQASLYYVLSLKPDPINPWSISVSFRRRVKREGLVVQTAFGKRYLRFHDLRHLFALRMLAESGNVEVVRRVLGHANPRTTLRYLDLLPEEEIRSLFYRL